MRAHIERDVTGGDSARLITSMHLADRWAMSTGKGGVDYMSADAYMQGIDAPDWQPAGCMNSTEYVNGLGAPVPHQTTVRRGGR